MSLASGKDYSGVDIFLSSEWPQNVWHYTAQPSGVEIDKLGSPAIAGVAKALKPRYHFSGLAKLFYERAPYRNHRVLSEPQTHVSRFFGLANVNNPDKKQKYLYAFNITPLSQMERQTLIVQPSNTTECPFKPTYQTAYPRVPGSDAGAASEQFFFDPKHLERGQKRPFENKGRGNNPKHHRSSGPQAPCWFCLGSPQVEKHLVVSVGDLV
jgi:hypothetical protein